MFKINKCALIFCIQPFPARSSFPGRPCQEGCHRLGCLDITQSAYKSLGRHFATKNDDNPFDRRAGKTARSDIDGRNKIQAVVLQIS
jgi:hypothetical protein